MTRSSLPSAFAALQRKVLSKEAASKAIVAALQPADIRAAIQKLGYNEPRGSTPQEFEAMIKADYGRWQQVVKASGFTPDD